MKLRTRIRIWLFGRSLKDLYKFLLQTMEYKIEHYVPNYSIFICTIILKLRDQDSISKKEYDLLWDHFKTLKPQGLGMTEPWFKSNKQRIKFLKNIINELY